MGRCTQPELGAAFLDVGGHRLAVHLSGQGPFTVVLETGLGAESAEWAAVEAEVKSFARVFRYDRAGRGASAPATRPRTAMDMIQDLQELVRRTTSPPYLLVGHSFGALLMRLYAATFPDGVAGLMLVDPMHEDQFQVFAKAFPPRSPYEPSELTVMRWFWTEGWRDTSSTAERIDLPCSLWQFREAPGLGDLPMRLLIAGTGRVTDVSPLEDRAALQALWRRLHRRTAALSTRSAMIDVPLSDHFIQRHDPHPIVAAIRDLADEVLTPGNRNMVTVA